MTPVPLLPRLALLLTLGLAACSHGPLPEPARPAPAPAVSATVAHPEAPDTTAPPAPAVASVTPVAAPADSAPRVDCRRLPAGASLDRQVCEAAVAAVPETLLDERGFALITQYEQAGEDVDEREGHQQKRVCGEEAKRRVKELYGRVLDTLHQSEGQDPWLTCRGLTCDLHAEGEWSVSSTLYFRQTGGKLALEAWTQIERTLVPEAEVKRREKLVAQGLQRLRGTSCPR